MENPDEILHELQRVLNHPCTDETSEEPAANFLLPLFAAHSIWGRWLGLDNPRAWPTSSQDQKQSHEDNGVESNNDHSTCPADLDPKPPVDAEKRKQQLKTTRRADHTPSDKNETNNQNSSTRRRRYFRGKRPTKPR